MCAGILMTRRFFEGLPRTTYLTFLSVSFLFLVVAKEDASFSSVRRCMLRSSEKRILPLCFDDLLVLDF